MRRITILVLAMALVGIFASPVEAKPKAEKAKLGLELSFEPACADPTGGAPVTVTAVTSGKVYKSKAGEIRLYAISSPWSIIADFDIAKGSDGGTFTVDIPDATVQLTGSWTVFGIIRLGPKFSPPALEVVIEVPLCPTA